MRAPGIVTAFEMSQNLAIFRRALVWLPGLVLPISCPRFVVDAIGGKLIMSLKASVIFVLVASGVSPGYTIAKPQSTVSPCAEAVDVLFRFSQGKPAEFQEFDYRVVVRYLPAFGPESQIQILGKSDGSLQIIQQMLREGIQSIHRECIAVLEANPNASTLDVVNRIGVQKQEIPSEHFVGLVEEFFTLSLATRLSPKPVHGWNHLSTVGADGIERNHRNSFGLCLWGSHCVACAGSVVSCSPNSSAKCERPRGPGESSSLR